MLAGVNAWRHRLGVRAADAAATCTYLAMGLPDPRQVQISDRDGEIAIELIFDQDWVKHFPVQCHKPNYRRDLGTARMNMKPLRYCCLLLLLGLSGLAAALEVPPLAGRVTDLAELLDAETRNRIDARLQTLEQAIGSQVAVLTLPSLGGEALGAFSLEKIW